MVLHQKNWKVSQMFLPGILPLFTLRHTAFPFSSKLIHLSPQTDLKSKPRLNQHCYCTKHSTSSHMVKNSNEMSPTKLYRKQWFRSEIYKWTECLHSCASLTLVNSFSIFESFRDRSHLIYVP